MAVLAALSSGLAFLLTQRLSSGSKKKLFFSPSLARMGLFGWFSSGASFFGADPAPHHEVRPQPFLALAAFSASARLAVTTR